MIRLDRFRAFLHDCGALIGNSVNEDQILDAGSKLLRNLVMHDDWLPDCCARSHEDHYQQYLLYCDAQERFSVVSFVWGPGQSTPVHNHETWGLVGVLRGAEQSQSYHLAENGLVKPLGDPLVLEPGSVVALSPTIGDIHRVENASGRSTSISIHIYGANIGSVRRKVFQENGVVRPFISGYANVSIPNIWGASS